MRIYLILHWMKLDGWRYHDASNADSVVKVNYLRFFKKLKICMKKSEKFMREVRGICDHSMNILLSLLLY